jgi:short-subunit dehydrogenase
MKLLVIGATSAIAHEVSRCFAADHASFFLVGRNPDKLDTARQDLTVRGGQAVHTYAQDLSDLHAHPGLIEAAWHALDGLDAALIAHGTLTDQKAAQSDVETTLAEFNLNATSYISLMTLLANRFEAQRQGCIAVISSVAGERGRGSNYVYGAAKGAVSLFAGGLRNRLEKSSVSVLTVKPGFVDTPMTAGLKKNPLYAKPAAVGKRIYTAMLKGEDVVYAPWFWVGIMGLIRNIPERVFKKLGL